MTNKPRAAGLRFSGLPLAAAITATTPISTVTDDGRVVAIAQGGGTVTFYLAFDETPAKAQRTSIHLAGTFGYAAHQAAIESIVGCSSITTSDTDYNRAVAWAKLTSYFLVTEEFGKGIWAGLPWFKNNWGRDTFIALPGTLLVSGMFDDARDVILNFLRYQDTHPKSPPTVACPIACRVPRTLFTTRPTGHPGSFASCMNTCNTPAT